jgi:prepilin signal peptidase PulO-like enzyme (type II secretory pathway)
MAYKKDSKDLGSFETVLDEGQIFINTREVELGKTGVVGETWVTPAIPFIVFMTLGFVISLLHGDLLTLIF